MTKAYRIKPEDAVCLKILDYCKANIPILHKSVIKIHNEGLRSVATNVFLLKLGLRKGASDLFFAIPNKKYAGLFMELKKEKWKMTKSQAAHINNQLEFISQMNANGYLAKMVIGADEGIALLNEYASDL